MRDEMNDDMGGMYRTPIVGEARGGVVDGLASGRPQKHAAITPGHYVHDAECEAMSGAACIDGPGCGFQADPPGCSVGPFDDKPMSGVAIVGATGTAETAEGPAYRAFVTAARSLKQTEEAYRAAQQTYAEAVKRLSEEAVK